MVPAFHHWRAFHRVIRGNGEEMSDDYRVWKRLAPCGLVLVRLGVSVALDASWRKARGDGALAWVAEGTAGLVALNAGLSLFGEAVKRRALYEIRAGGA